MQEFNTPEETLSLVTTFGGRVQAGRGRGKMGTLTWDQSSTQPKTSVLMQLRWLARTRMHLKFTKAVAA